MSTRRDFDKQDAYDLVRSEINRELRRYRIRLMGAALAAVDKAHAEASVTGEVFDYEACGRAALAEAQRLYFAADLPPGDPLAEVEGAPTSA